jgi:hypothetical protein
MSLSVEDFFEKFSEAELKEVHLSTMGDTVFLRSLPYAKVWQFRLIASKIARSRALDVMTGEKDDKGWEIKKSRAEEYLIEEALANHDGSKFFKDAAQFKKWRELVKNEVVNEILYHIDEMNELGDGFGDAEKAIEKFKAKKK